MEPADSTLDACVRPAVPGTQVLPSDEPAAAMLAAACGIGTTAAQVLLHRGIRDVDHAQSFLGATLRGLTPPDSMADRSVAAERLGRAVRNGERVVVFGDYDVDGTTSALILTEILQVLGGDAVALVADRFRGGYGLSDEALDRSLERGPGLLVTCDCGSSDHVRIERAKRRGVDVIVVDHHRVPAEPIPALAFLNPHRPECAFPFKGLCSAGLAFSLGAAVRAEMKAQLDLRPWLDLVAVGTIADLAPLTEDNRRLVRAGLKRLGSPEGRPAFRALLQLANLSPSMRLTARDVSFRLAPRLNAPGRLGDADLTLRLLQARDAAEAWALAEEVERTNEARRTLAQQATEQALAQAVEIYGEAPECGIVVADDGWHRGVVGIVAARLADALGVPAAVVAFDGREGHGSVRSVGTFDAYTALATCANHLEGWGGHTAAAGFSLQKSRLDPFRTSFSQVHIPSQVDSPSHSEAASTATPSQVRLSQSRAYAAAVPVDVELGGAFRVPTLNDLERLGPFGHGFPAPRFLLPARILELKPVGDEGGHAKMRIQVGQEAIRAFAPGFFSQVEGREEARLVGEFRPDHWIGGTAIEFLVTEVLI